MKKNKTIVAPLPFRSQPARSHSIQLACGTPGCTDPKCDDPRNHGFDSVRNLRGRTLYHRTVSSSDIGKGTDTNKGTRKYVNSPGTTYPRQVSMEYSGVKKPGRGGRSEFINHRPAKGQNADAGHILGNQFGGKGNQNASVFPQHPPTNRGNYHKGKPTRHKWRALEDNIRKSAQSGEEPSVTVTLRDTRRVSYKHRACNQCWFINPLGAVTCVQCGHLL